MLRGAVQIEDGQEMGGGGVRPTAVAPPCITGRIYEIVQTTGLDGKNLLRLLPVSKSLKDVGSPDQSFTICDNDKGNVSVSGHNNMKEVFTNSASCPFVKISERKISAPGRLILPKPLDPMENIKLASIVKVNPITKTISNIPSNSVTSVCPPKNNRECVFVNTKNLPVATKSPVLPSGHYLQIPAHAKVESVPATFLPPIIQQKILSVKGSNACETTNAPNVIYMSPVHTVKTVPEPLQTECPKPVAEVSDPLSVAIAKTMVSSSCLGIYDSQEKQAAPMKWVVKENPQSSASCLVPVKSSNIIASKVLKTLTDMKNEKTNPAKVLSAYVNSSNESQARISSSSIKDNALVMCNGKVYFLVKKKAPISTDECNKQVSANAETQFRKNTLHLLNSAVNLVLSKNKQITSSTNDFKSSEDPRLELQSEQNKDLKATSSLISPHQDLQISSTRHNEEASFPQGNLLETNVSNAQKSVTRRKVAYAVLHKIISTRATATCVPLSPKQDVSEDEIQKTEEISSMAAQSTDWEEQKKKQYLELRKKFGLHKEERLYLKRICLSDIKRPETSRCSSTAENSVCNKLIQTVSIELEQKEEKKLIEEQEELNIKRSRKIPTMLENAKRRKMETESVLNPELEDRPSYSVIDGSSSPCRQDISQQEGPTSFLNVSQGTDSSSNTCVQREERNIISSVSHCCENESPLNEDSFKKDLFLSTPPDLEDTIRDEKITKLKLLLQQREAALEEIRKQMHQT